MRQRVGFCNECLTHFAAQHSAVVLRLGDDARSRFRVRHEPCGAITDVSLPMLRRGWVCRMCKLRGLTATGWIQGHGEWSLDRQEQLLTVAGCRALAPMIDNCPADFPMNVECLECHGAQTDSLFGLSEGVRLSWLPCSFCNAARFKPTDETIQDRLRTLGLELLSPWTGDPGAGLEARCLRCGTDRIVSWTALGSVPPCLRCDGRRLDPTAPHRVYLFVFPHLGPFGVYKEGITHCVDDRRLAQHRAIGGRLLQIVEVQNRAAAFAIEASVLRDFQPLSPTTIDARDLPYGGSTECWDAIGGYPHLVERIAHGKNG